jgi:hypothetical protein
MAQFSGDAKSAGTSHVQPSISLPVGAASLGTQEAPSSTELNERADPEYMSLLRALSEGQHFDKDGQEEKLSG